MTLGAVAHAERPSDQPPPSCLDQSITDELGQTLRPRGVQKREFLKNKRLQLTAHGGLFASDLLSSSYAYGGAAAYYLTEDLALEVRVDVTQIALDLDGPIADFFGDPTLDDRFESASAGVLGLAGLLWSPIHAKLKLGDSIVHSDIMLALGAGRMFHDTVQGVAFDGGVIIEMLTTNLVTLRIDLRDVVLVQEAIGETRLTNNIVASVGLSFWLPFW